MELKSTASKSTIKTAQPLKSTTVFKSNEGNNDDDLRLEKDTKPSEEEDTDEPEWKRRRREKRQVQEGGGNTEYRDRAKERREGQNVDYKSLEGMTQSNEDDRRRQAELSKYLGGDIEHTHLVKGLDKALASKVRREEMGIISQEDTSGGDLDQLFEHSYAQKKQQSKARSSKPTTELGKSILTYLSQKQQTAKMLTSSSIAYTATATQVKTNTIVQKSIQQSVMTFSLDSDVRKKRNAWEVPKISVKVFASSSDNHTNQRKMTPLNQHMITTISKKLNGGGDSLGKAEKEKRIDMYTSNNKKDSNIEEERTLHQNGTLTNTAKDDGTKANNATNGGSTKYDDDSDDDIFADVGEYEHQGLKPKLSDSSAVASTDTIDEGDNEHASRNNVAKQEKKSIFDNLLTETEQVPVQDKKRHLLQLNQLQQKQQQITKSNKDIIDRDILGGKQNNDLTSQQPYQKQSAAMDGVSMINYEGGYGEEHDVDFGGDDDEWQKKRKDEKDKKEDDANADDKDDDDDDNDDE